MLRVVPFVVDVHDEPGWGRLLAAVPKAGEHARGIGIPSGGGALYHPDYSVEPVRHPLVEVSQAESGLQQALLLPGQASTPAEPPTGGRGTGEVVERERADLGYSVGADGVIELRRPAEPASTADPNKEPVN
jgi:hypothetical protein